MANISIGEIIALAVPAISGLIGLIGRIVFDAIQAGDTRRIQEISQEQEGIKVKLAIINAQGLSDESKKKELEALLIELDGLKAKQHGIPLKRRNFNILMLVSILVLIIGIIIIIFARPSMSTCPYQGAGDNETIVNLIQAEAIASNARDVKIMQSIFASDAIFYDYATPPLNPPKKWVGPLARYKDDLFKSTEFKQVEHFDILPVGSGIAGDMAWYTSGSKGFYRFSGGQWQPLSNGSLVSINPPATPFGSEHWKLQKNHAGCWVIIEMDFNAGHIKFP
jgi:hypothetical protein